MTRVTPSAARPEERVEALDALRGIALFGVLTVNLIDGFRVSIFEQFLHAPDSILLAAIRYALELKAFALFSLLFGAGLAIQRERLASYWLVRRLAVLLAFGVIHLLLIWNGDILTEYAIAGLLALPFLGMPTWALALASAAFFIFYFSSAGLLPVPDPGWIQAHVAEANRVYATGSFLEIRSFSLQEIPSIALLHAHIFSRTLGLFLLGALAWRTRVFERRDILLLIAVAGLIGGATLSAPGAREVLLRLGNVLLALGYGAVVVLLARHLRLFAPLGRMAFTNYLLQSLVLGAIFYGYGLGLFGRVGVAQAFALGVVLYAVQLAFSAWWLKRCRFGPVEWLWRTLMYGARQPWRSRA